MAQRRKVMKHIPYEIIFQILVRLPVKSLLRFQLACKLWFSMINSDRAFIRAHLQHVKHTNDPSFKRHLFVSNFHIVSYDYSNLNRMFDYPTPFEHYDNVDILASCDGLFFISHNDQYYLWNPSTRLYKHIAGTYFFKEQCTTYGLGYDKASEAYKVVKILRVASHKNFSMHQRAIGEYEYDATSIKVYNCRTESWKRFDDPFPYNIYTQNQGVVVNGAPHWMVFRNDDEGEMREYVIMYFDLQDEKFKEVEVPTWLVHSSSFELCDFDDQLCLVRYNFSDIAIWVMKIYGVAESWTHLFTLNRGESSYVGVEPLLDRGDRKIFLVRQRNGLVILSGLNNPTIDPSDVPRARHRLCDATTYVESLVSPNGWDRADED